MRAEGLISRRLTIAEGVFTEVVLWRVPAPLRGSTHSYKYRLALVADGICVLRYDNEAGKGDHKHVGDRQVPYRFSDVDQLLADFSMDVRRWLDENGRV
jgi:uncharacterized protein DUF6516